jgi:NAD-dependent DNA ligase
VSGETDYLVVGDNPGSKLDATRRQQVEILDLPRLIQVGEYRVNFLK